jgi:hypothetical protein
LGRRRSEGCRRSACRRRACRGTSKPRAAPPQTSRSGNRRFRDTVLSQVRRFCDLGVRLVWKNLLVVWLGGRDAFRTWVIENAA